MKKYFTAIAKEDYENEQHTWSKGFDYQMAEFDGVIRLASNEGMTSISEVHRQKVEELFEIKEGWAPS